MDDQNKTNQPLDQGVPPVVPQAPVEAVPLSVTPEISAPTPSPEPVVPPTPPVFNQESAPVSQQIMPVAAPEPLTTPPVSIPTPTSSPETPAEPPLPRAKPKRGLSALMGVAALLLVVGVAGAAYYVSNQLSTRQAVAPNAPTSKPMAGGACTGQSQANCTGTGCKWNTTTNVCEYCQASTDPCVDTCGYTQPGCSRCKCPGETTFRQPAKGTCTEICGGGGSGDGNEESSSAVYVNKSDYDGSCNNTTYHRYDCGTQCCRTKVSGGNSEKDANCCTSGCVEPDSSGVLSGAEEKYWCEARSIDKFQEANEVTFKKTGLAKIYLGSSGFNYKVVFTKITGDGPTTFTIPSSGYTASNKAYDIGNVTANAKYKIAVTLKEDVDVGRGASLGWRKPKSAQTTHPSCDASATVTAAKALFTLKEDTTEVNYPVMCWADSIIEGGPAQSPAEKWDFDDFVVAVGYGTATSDCSVKYFCNTNTYTCQATTGTFQNTAPYISCDSTLTPKPDCATSLANDTANPDTGVCYPNIDACSDQCKRTEIGACVNMKIYKKVGTAYSTTALTTAELQTLKVGDVLKFTVDGNIVGLKNRFRVTIDESAGEWLTGSVLSAGVTGSYENYTVSKAGTYKFEAQVSTQ